MFDCEHEASKLYNGEVLITLQFPGALDADYTISVCSDCYDAIRAAQPESNMTAASGDTF